MANRKVGAQNQTIRDFKESVELDEVCNVRLDRIDCILYSIPIVVRNALWDNYKKKSYAIGWNLKTSDFVCQLPYHQTL